MLVTPLEVVAYRWEELKGRKRHLLVDTLGLVLKSVGHSATIQDRDGAKPLPKGIQLEQPLLEKIWADGGYRGQLIAWVKQPLSKTEQRLRS